MAERNTTSRELLLGLYALESGSIDQTHLLRAARAWARFPEKTLSEILAGGGRLDATAIARLQNRVKWDLALTENNAVLDDGTGTRDRPDRPSGNDPTVTVDEPRSVTDEAAAAPASTTSEVSGRGADGDRFRILRSQTRGGLGEVFLAFDTELNRSVALKELQARRAHDPAVQARFLFEAEVTGRLEHPGIVPVYSLNRYADGRPFYAMRLLAGGTLRDAIDRSHRGGASAEGLEARELAFRRLLRSLIDVCNAVAYAHGQGVVHRDLKPENVMLGQFGETLVVDWGIAKLHPEVADPAAETSSAGRAPSDPSQTRPGSLLGTPRYMSPEQAEGDLGQVGPSSDIYSLGAILYCVLVGHDAFADGDTAAVLGRVRRGIFPGPRRLRRSIDPTLETICLKAMSLEPRDRHATPLELAEELEKWLSDVRHRAEHEAAFLQVKSSLARLALERAHRCFERDACDEGMLWPSRALEDAPAEPPTLQRVVRLSLRFWHDQAKLMERRFHHDGDVHAVDFCPEGRRLATAGGGRTAQLWDLATGSSLSPPLRHEAPVRAVTFRPDGALVATADDDGLIRFWDAITGEPAGDPIHCGSPVTALRFSREGARVAAANGPGGAFLWDPATGRSLREWDEPCAPILAILFTPNGSALAVARPHGGVFLLDSTTGATLGEPLAHAATVIRLAFDPTGQRLLTGGLDGQVRLWDLTRRIAVVTLADQGEIRCLGFRADGDVFATSGDEGAARLWESATGRPIGERLEHGSRADRLAFRPDGIIVATGSQDGTVRLWCATTGLPIGPPLPHGGAVRAVVFSRDGGRLVSSGLDATVRCWAIPDPLEADAERVSYWVRIMTNLEFDEGDAIRRMDVPTGWDLRRRLDDLGGPPLRQGQARRRSAPDPREEPRSAPQRTPLPPGFGVIAEWSCLIRVFAVGSLTATSAGGRPFARSSPLVVSGAKPCPWSAPK